MGHCGRPVPKPPAGRQASPSRSTCRRPSSRAATWFRPSINALAASGLPAGRLELEITELVLLQDNEGAFAVLHQLRDLGIRIAMDDFGTGYSSLGYLRSFPFDKIKIDQSFIRDLPRQGRQPGDRSRRGRPERQPRASRPPPRAWRRTSSSRACTAEGCNEFQGFLFSAPQSAADIVRILEAGYPGTPALGTSLKPAPL